MHVEARLHEELLDLSSELAASTFDDSIKVQMLLNGEPLEENIELGTEADAAARFGGMRVDIVAIDLDEAARFLVVAANDVDERRFSGSIMAKKHCCKRQAKYASRLARKHEKRGEGILFVP